MGLVMAERSVADQIARLASQYSDLFVKDMDLFLSPSGGQADLRLALTGTLISFFAEVLSTVSLDERDVQLVPTQARIPETTGL